jgi:hypothetical protein
MIMSYSEESKTAADGDDPTADMFDAFPSAALREPILGLVAAESERRRLPMARASRFESLAAERDCSEGLIRMAIAHSELGCFGSARISDHPSMK